MVSLYPSAEWTIITCTCTLYTCTDFIYAYVHVHMYLQAAIGDVIHINVHVHEGPSNALYISIQHKSLWSPDGLMAQIKKTVVHVKVPALMMIVQFLLSQLLLWFSEQPCYPLRYQFLAKE